MGRLSTEEHDQPRYSRTSRLVPAVVFQLILGTNFVISLHRNVAVAYENSTACSQTLLRCAIVAFFCLVVR